MMKNSVKTWVNVHKTHIYLDLAGPSFSPKKAEEKTGLTLHDKLERGMPSHLEFPRHPEHGKPSKIGQGVLQAPEQVEAVNQWQWLLRTVRKHANTFRRLGATDMVLWRVDYLRTGAQENFELSVSEMALLARAKVPFCLSVYHLSKTGISEMRNDRTESCGQQPKP